METTNCKFTERLLLLRDASNAPRYTRNDIVEHERLPHWYLKQFVENINNTISADNDPFRIAKFKLFLVSNPTPNARALPGDHNIICIHLFLFEVLRIKLANRISSLDLPIVKAFQNGDADEPDWIFYQMVTMFIYLHELGHLNQGKMKRGGMADVSEADYLTPTGTFDKTSHAKEIDADWFAAQRVADAMLNYWKRLPENIRTNSNLEDFIALTCASVCMFFYTVRNKWQDFYLLSHKHPHDIIRISYITDAIIGITSIKIEGKGFEPSAENCSKQAMYYLNHLLSEANNLNPVVDYAEMYLKNKHLISHYMTNVMRPFSNGLEYLIQNWRR